MSVATIDPDRLDALVFHPVIDFGGEDLQTTFPYKTT